MMSMTKGIYLVMLSALLHSRWCRAGVCNDVKEREPRICNGDFTTPGRCFELFEEPKDWHEADKDCKDLAPSQPSYLAIIRSQAMQDLVQDAVIKKGWPYTWINACLKEHAWFWLHEGQYQAYQGCYIDDPSSPDLANLKNLPSVSKPSDCLDACEEDGKMFASVQLDQEKRLVCRCSNSHERKYNLVYDSECDNHCSGGEQYAAASINIYCGGYERQLVYRVKGERFQAWAPTAVRSNAECVSLDQSHHHRWVERDCRDAIGYVCFYSIWNEGHCERTSSNHRWLRARICVTIHNGPVDFYGAQVACLKNEGRLHRPFSNEDFGELISHLDSQTSYYFGLTHEEWIYSSHKRILDYFNWGTNQPASDNDQECVLLKESDGYKWHNVECYQTLPFVCSVDICSDEDTPTKSTTEITIVPPGDGNESAPRRGLSQDFYIGLGAGIGGAIVLALIIVGIILCCKQRRHNKEKETYREGPRDAAHRPGLNLTNPTYSPDIIPGSRTGREPTQRTQRSNNSNPSSNRSNPRANRNNPRNNRSNPNSQRSEGQGSYQEINSQPSSRVNNNLAPVNEITMQPGGRSYQGLNPDSRPSGRSYQGLGPGYEHHYEDVESNSYMSVLDPTSGQSRRK